MVDIKIENVTNVSKTGTFDILMGSINSHINEQYTENRITGTDYANVYLGSIQAALAQSIQFHMQDELTEAQVAGVLADNLVKAEQRLQIIKQVDVSERDMVEKEATGAKNRILLDEEKETSDLQQIILGTEEEIKTAQLVETVDSTVRANTQLDDALVTSTEQRASMYTERVLKDKQAAKLGLDNVMKQSETSRDADPAFKYLPNYTGAQ